MRPVKPARALAPLLAALLAGGCTTGGLVALEAPRDAGYYPTVEIRPASTIPPTEVRENFEGRLFSRLSDAGMRKGTDLIVEYYVMLQDRGSRTDRFWYLGLSDVAEGKLDVEVIFRDPAGKKLARIQARGRIKGGVTGGSFVQAVNSAADRVAEYTLRWFFTGDYAPMPGVVPVPYSPPPGGTEPPSFDSTSVPKFSTTTNRGRS